MCQVQIRFEFICIWHLYLLNVKSQVKTVQEDRDKIFFKKIPKNPTKIVSG